MPAKMLWHTGYDSTNPGNFVNLATLTAAQRKAFEEQITGIFEQKGVHATETKKYIQMAEDHARTEGTGLKGALVWASQQTGSAEDRGDVWGSGVGQGRNWLRSIAGWEGYTPTAVPGNTQEQVKSLYTKGFGRSFDQGGVNYWSDQINKGNADIGRVAQLFLESEEGKIRDAYHKYYGRDADDKGLLYWINRTPGDDSQQVRDVLASDQTVETQIRDIFAAKLGQYSQAEDRHDDWFTDPEEGGYDQLDWTDLGETVQAGQTFDHEDAWDTGMSGSKAVAGEKTGVAEYVAAVSAGDASTTISPFDNEAITEVSDVEDEVGRIADIMTIGATYDVDDSEGGTGIGKIINLHDATTGELSETMETYLPEDSDLTELATELGETKWDILTKEEEKIPMPDDVFTPIYTGNTFQQYPMGIGGQDDRYSHPTLHSDYQVPVPDDYTSPDSPNVTNQTIDYFDTKPGDFTDRSGYGNVESAFRDLQKNAQTTAKTVSRRGVQPIMGSSAEGVRMKRSKASRTGASSKGTGQLKRQMQIQSLNI